MMRGETTELSTKICQRLIRVVFCIALGSSLLTCKRNFDDTAPVIYSAQFHGGSVHYQEDLLVSVQVMDETRLTDVSIVIVNPDGIEQLPAIHYQPGYRDDLTTSSIPMNSVFMNSGTYYVKVTASDGEHTSMRFFVFDYVGAARQLNHIWSIRGSGDQRTLDTLSNGQWQTVSSSSERWIALSHWPRHQQGALVSHEQIFTFPWFDSNQWTPHAIPDSITADALDEQNGMHFWGLRNGDIYLTDADEVRIYYAGDAVPVLDIAVGNDYIFVLKGYANSSNRSVLVLHKSTGYPYHFAGVDWPAIGLIRINDDEAYIIGNLGGVGHIERFINATSSVVPVWQSFQTSEVLRVWPGDDQRFYVAQADGLVRYTMDLMDYHLGMSADIQSIDMETVHQQLYVRTANGLLLGDLDGNYISTLSPDPLVDLFLEYNK